MNHKTTIRLPYSLRIGPFSFVTKKKISISFDNLALFLFRENNKIENMDSLKKWHDENGEYKFMLHQIYAAAQSSALQHNKKFDLTLSVFAKMVADADKSEIDKIVRAWTNSNTYAAKKKTRQQKPKPKK